MNGPVIGITCGTARSSPSESPKFASPRDYADCVVRAGGRPLLLPPVCQRGYVEAALELLDGVMIAGGSDADPALYGEEPMCALGPVDVEKSRFEYDLTRQALQRGMPLFGICGGMQMLNVAAGGSLYQDIGAQTQSKLQHRQETSVDTPFHTIRIEPDSVLHRIVGQEMLRVNSRHHQAINSVAPAFRVTARATDGIVEAIETDGAFVLGVQFHPESLAAREPLFQRLFDEFSRACARQ